METGPLARTLPIGTKEHNNAHRRDALCPSTKIQKQAAFGINVFLAKGTNVQVSASRKKGVIFYPLDFCSGSIYFKLESVADLMQNALPHV